MLSGNGFELWFTKNLTEVGVSDCVYDVVLVGKEGSLSPFLSLSRSLLVLDKQKTNRAIASSMLIITAGGMFGRPVESNNKA